MINLRLEGISRLLAKTPLPWRAIHVAGTNGKGTICAYISAMLDYYNEAVFEKGVWKDSRRFELAPRPWERSLQKWTRNHGASKSPLTHGRFTSPHLVDRWDCIKINEETIPFEHFRSVENAMLRRNKEEDIGATQFELLTATAFQLFTEEKVDIAVVEVGMGGRLDASTLR